MGRSWVRGLSGIFGGGRVISDTGITVGTIQHSSHMVGLTLLNAYDWLSTGASHTRRLLARRNVVLETNLHDL